MTAVLKYVQQAGLVRTSRFHGTKFCTGIGKIDHAVRCYCDVVGISDEFSVVAVCEYFDAAVWRDSLQTKIRICDQQVSRCVKFDAKRSTTGFRKYFYVAAIRLHSNDESIEGGGVNQAISVCSHVLWSFVLAEIYQSRFS